MNRIDQTFQDKKNILSVYYTAGYPSVDNTVTIAQYLEEAGADIIEIGMPFSDPVADGPTIQASNKRALDNGMTLKLLFDQIKSLRDKMSLPVILMGYLNPIIQFGIDKFCERCETVGIDGLILPDLPMAEYLNVYREKFEQHGLKNIFLITPQTSESRIRDIDNNSDGFIYMVSAAGTTGAKNDFKSEQLDYFQRIKKMNLKNPTLIGFGISNHETFVSACKHSHGAIIGSAFINLLDKSNGMEKDIKEFVKNIKG